MKKIILFLFTAAAALAQSTGGMGITPISRGGTGANTASGARLNLGVSSGYSVVAANISALKATSVSGLADGTVIYVLGYSTATDGGGGMFRYSSTSSATVDGGTIFAPNTGAGRWFRQYGGDVLPEWFGATTTTDSTTAVQAAIDAAGAGGSVRFDKIFKVGQVAVNNANEVLHSGNGGGLIHKDGLSSVLYIGAVNVTVMGLKITGYKQTTDVNTVNYGIFVDAHGATIDGCEISYCSHVGVIFTTSATGSAVTYPTVLRNCFIHHNSTGVYLQEFEYLSIENNRITDNGFNATETDWSGDYGPGTGYGVYGPFSNVAFVNNQVLNNTIGVFVNSTGASNPDHNKIVANNINHNRAAGLIVEGVFNYMLIEGNVMLSNVLDPSAPNVKYAATNSSHSMVLVDVVNCIISGNAIDCASYSDKMPIFGHARCRYIGNNFVFCVPYEMRAPAAGTALHDTYGYTVNGDNSFVGNAFMTTTYSTPQLLSGTIRTYINNNTQSVAGNIQNVDGIEQTPTMASNWTSGPTGFAPVKFWIDHNNVVHVSGVVSAAAGAGANPFQLPAGYRPSGNIDFLISEDGTPHWARVYSDGTVQLVGTGTTTNISLNFCFPL